MVVTVPKPPASVARPIELANQRVSMHADYPQRLRSKLERLERRRLWIRNAAPVFGFAIIVVLVIAALVHP